MGFAKSFVAQALLVAVMAALLQQLCHAAVYKVGDSAGWTTLNNIDYDKWAADKNFKVGDTFLFVYHKEIHNVLQVTEPKYRACNALDPLKTYTSGNDSITIKEKGHHYFLCGFPGHCQAGQKVDINVLDASETTSSPATTPSPSNAVTLNQWSFGMLGLAMAVFAFGFY